MNFKVALYSMLFLLMNSLSTLAQSSSAERHRLNCDGIFLNAPARIMGIRQYRESSGAGGFVSGDYFEGQLQSPQGTVGLVYEIGANANGLLLTNPPTPVSVLDNTGGKMIIYYGKPSLGPPDKVGEFVCQWTRL